MKIDYSNRLGGGEKDNIIHKVILHDRASIGAGAPRPIGFGARCDGALIGGICGHVELRCLYVDYLWVDESHRCHGIGSHLLKMAEDAAAGQGCLQCRIESLSLKTAHIYIARGYRVMHCIPDYIPGLPLIILSKQI